MKSALKITEKMALKVKVYKEGEEDEDSDEDRQDLTEVICDNHILMERVNQYLDGDAGGESSRSHRSRMSQSGAFDNYTLENPDEEVELTDTMIDGLYNEMRHQKNEKKK